MLKTAYLIKDYYTFLLKKDTDWKYNIREIKTHLKITYKKAIELEQELIDKKLLVLSTSEDTVKWKVVTSFNEEEEPIISKEI
jgi:hypothetical protein